MHENLWQWICRMGRVGKLRAKRSAQRLVGRWICEHEWQEPYYVHGPWAFSRCVKCDKKRRTR